MKNNNREHHKTRYCLDCGKKLNYHEWYYGACSECIKRRAKERHWGERNGYDSAGWLYACNAPRWKEYASAEDMDDTGVVLLIRALVKEGAYFGQSNFGNATAFTPYSSPASNKGRPRKAIPEGLKRCGVCSRLIPIVGPSRCESCAARMREKQKQVREQRRLSHECIHCGAKLARGWAYTKCQHCLEASRQKKEQE